MTKATTKDVAGSRQPTSDAQPKPKRETVRISELELTLRAWTHKQDGTYKPGYMISRSYVDRQTKEYRDLPMTPAHVPVHKKLLAYAEGIMNAFEIGYSVAQVQQVIDRGVRPEDLCTQVALEELQA